MKILAIETSCDETAIALVEAKGNPLLKNRFASSAGWRIKILKNFVASQIKIHRPFGGVVPNLAKREHLKNLPALLKKIQDSRFKIQDSDLIAVTVGPGLEPALWTGINFAKEIHRQLTTNNSASRRMTTKLIGANHLEGHLYSFLLENKIEMSNVFPAIHLLVSGGHTILIKMDSLVKYKKIGETRDDAAGECFDKVARLLNLPYPGGPEIEKLAKKGNPNAINFPRPMLNQKNYDFSFSGLKTAVLYYLRDKLEAENIFCRRHVESDSYKLPKRTRGKPELTEGNSGRIPEVSEDNLSIAKTAGGKIFLADIAASFQQAAFDVLILKTLRAAEEFNANSIFISGGVASNNSLRNYLKSEIKNQKSKLNVFFPEKNFCTDNAAMIAVAGYIDYIKGKKRRLIAKGNLSL